MIAHALLYLYNHPSHYDCLATLFGISYQAIRKQLDKGLLLKRTGRTPIVSIQNKLFVEAVIFEWVNQGIEPTVEAIMKMMPVDIVGLTPKVIRNMINSSTELTVADAKPIEAGRLHVLQEKADDIADLMVTIVIVSQMSILPCSFVWMRPAFANQHVGSLTV